MCHIFVFFLMTMLVLQSSQLAEPLWTGVSVGKLMSLQRKKERKEEKKSAGEE